jgi:two-component sensor histidine kinase
MLQLQELTMLNKESQEALSSSRKRIKTTALIHEMLYRNETFNEISLKEFITELYELLKTNNNFILFTSGEDIKFNLSTALPLGLMLNELMLNSFKHSFDGLDQGKTEIAINTDNGKLNIEYCDCKGVFPQEVDFSNSNTTGLTLIHTFADQLEGKIELISNQPPKYLIQIPLDENHQ